MNWIWSGVLSGSLSFESLHTAISSCTKRELQIQSFKRNFLTARLVSSEEATLQLGVKSTAKIMSKLLTIHTKSSGIKGTPRKWCILCHFTSQRTCGLFFLFSFFHFFPPENQRIGKLRWAGLLTGLRLNFTQILERSYSVNIPPPFLLTLREHQSNIQPQWRKGHATNEDVNWCSWSPRSPELTPCDLLFVPPMPTNFAELEPWITRAVTSVTRQVGAKVWEATEYRIAACLWPIVCP